jgi:hypothetical protein
LNYILSVNSPSSVLVFSFIGMQSKEVPLNGKTKVDVVLETDAIGLSGSSCYWYGIAKKSD